MDVQSLLTDAKQRNASDVHLATGHPAMMRIDGDLRPVDEKVLSEEDVLAFCQAILTEAQNAEWQESFEFDCSYEIPGVARFRVNMFRQISGPSVVLRLIPLEIPDLDSLGLPDIFKTLCGYSNGLVLVTGPTGSGKSTTLAAMIKFINQSNPTHIMTLEDPIEFMHQSKQALIQQREVSTHTKNYQDALRGALREDPDIILVGEMRDPETIRLALTAAETGHLVFSTLHTSSAPKTVNRIIDVFPAAEKAMVRSMLSESLRAVISQTLLKRKDGGRVAAHEIMICNSAICNLIREDKIQQIPLSIQTGQSEGMMTLEQSIQQLSLSGKI